MTDMELNFATVYGMQTMFNEAYINVLSTLFMLWHLVGNNYTCSLMNNESSFP